FRRAPPRPRPFPIPPPSAAAAREGLMALSLNIGKSTNLGNYRENNEDCIDVKVFPDLTVAVVADGMGGQAAGEIASKRAVDIIPRELRKSVTPGVNTEATKV